MNGEAHQAAREPSSCPAPMPARGGAAAKKRLGEMLVEAGLMSAEQLQEALKLQRESGKRIGQVLVEAGFISWENLANALGGQLGIPHIWLRKGLVDPEVVHLVPKDKAKLFTVIPMFKVKDKLTIATADPQAIYVFDELAKLTGCQIQPVICRAQDILEAIEQYYQEDVALEDFLAEAEAGDLELVRIDLESNYQSVEELAEGSPIINLVNKLILRAIKERASDVHIEPGRRECRIRYRIDGVLYEAMSLKMDLLPAIVSRLKIMAGLDIAERRLPQDGRIQVVAERRTVDLRFSSLPGIFGEKVVLRVLDKSAAVFDVARLGFNPEALARFKAMIRKPFGLILVTGPTGSGKTTTLYAAVNLLSSVEKNIVSIEDPVEYQLDMVNQNQVRENIGLTFARILKHTLRQDPDIIMVGEIRDKDTAHIAIHASLTGHLVLSTLHTNDSAGAISRLLDMGIEPYLLASSLIGVVAQRLVRTICPACRVNYYPPASLLKQLGWEEETGLQLAKGRGCAACYDSGYKGRAGIMELLEVDRDFQRLILGNPTAEMVRSHMAERKLGSLLEEGHAKVRQGVTTIEEVTRAVHVE